MPKAKVLFSVAHDEDFPDVFVEKLPKEEILYESSSEPLTLESLDEYTCVALIDPKTSISKEEKEAVMKYKEKDGGVFLTINLLNESQYERFKPNMDFVKSIVGVDLFTKRVQPEFDAGEYYIEYEREEGLIFKEKDRIKLKKRIKFLGNKICRIIKYVNRQVFQTNIVELKIDEVDRDFVSYFSICERSRVILEREMPFILPSDSNYFGKDGFYLLEFSPYNSEIKNGKKYSISNSFSVWNNISNEYKNVGIISDLSQLGRAVCLCTNKLFDEIENKRISAEISQKLLQDFLIWTSEPTKYKLKIIKDEKHIVCPQCSAEMPSYAKFCGKCGHPLN